MGVSEDLDRLAARFGILPDYHDFDGERIGTSPDTQKALLRANGLSLENDAMIHELRCEFDAMDKARLFPQQLIIERGKPFECQFGADANWRVVLEGQKKAFAQGSSSVKISLPPLPGGVHDLVTDVAALEFGLGRATVVEELTIRWPSGTVQTRRNVAVDRYLTITEPVGMVRRSRGRRVP